MDLMQMREIRRAYGIDHVEICAVMRPGILPFSCNVMPTADDVAGVTALYP